ncbi:type IV pilus modification protein PilV [Diaphorobacter sp. LR2014-1]|uniref:type IV pilus modification protein PilV n=1 Tax=Diaphorobacter sp. LR2014-1 TaxID=1933219 RepID=UPI000D4ACCAD|nr:type IV pilus modification protein PilV [Diaphorobacter sp. LR2014-1]POR11793.1 type IV pilus modification protein PilV [Diaphorobacter sp. LR2014-1]
MNHQRSTPLRSQHGSSLLEVLVTILIMSFGLLGVAGLTAASLQAVKMSQFQSTALQLVNEYADRMRGNVSGVASKAYDMTDAYSGASASVTVPSCAAPQACTPAELASIDRAEWTNSLRRRLPGGGSYVALDANGLSVDIWIMWQEPGLDFDNASTLSVAATGGSPCPDAALAGYAGDAPICIYYRVSI